MKKNYFSKAYLSFFKQLAANNNRDWFEKHKPEFTEHVKKPFEAFVADLIAEFKKELALEGLTPSDCIFRIHKDVRFSKDKAPYKLQMSALITPGGRKNMSSPGLYIEAGPEFMHIYTGFYMPEKEQLSELRHRIASDPAGAEKIISDKKFRASFGEVKGDRSKILPPDMKPLAGRHPLIYNKQFYLQHTCPAEKILEDGLLKYVAGHFRNAAAFNAFMSGKKG